MNNRISYKKIIYWLIICLLAFFIHWGHPINADEGIILTDAWRVYQGQIPYIDFFNFITPGSFYLLALTFKIFSPSYLVAKIFSIFLLIFSAFGLFLISGFYLKKPQYRYTIPIIWVLISSYNPAINFNPSSLFAVLSVINHNLYSIFLLIWSFYFWLKSYQTNLSFYYFITGIFSGLTFWLLQSRGIIIIFTVIFLTLVYRFKKIKKITFYLLGLIISLLPFLYWPIDILLSNLIKFPIIYYLPANQISYFPLVYLLLIHLIILIFNPLTQNKKEVWFLWWLGLFLYLSALPRPDIDHLIFSCWVLLILIFWQLENWERNKIKKWLLFAFSSHFLVVVLLIYGLSQAFYLFNFGGNFKNWLTLKNPYLSEIINYIQNHTQKNDFIYAGPYLPNFYFEIKRNNPTRFNHLNHHPDTLLFEAVTDLKQKKPTLILLDYRIPAFSNYKKNLIDNYIWQNYQLDQELFGVQILKLKPSP